MIIFILLGGFICFGGVLFCIFFPEIANKSCKIAFPICYFFNSFFFIQLVLQYNNDYSSNTSCPVKKLIAKDSKYKKIKIKIIDDKV